MRFYMHCILRIKVVDVRAIKQIKMPLLYEVRKKLRALNVPYVSLSLSEKPNKKIRVIIDNKVIHFGDKRSQTFLEGASESKRKAYKARHERVLLKDGRRAIDVKYTPAWLSYHILW